MFGSLFQHDLHREKTKSCLQARHHERRGRKIKHIFSPPVTYTRSYFILLFGQETTLINVFSMHLDFLLKERKKERKSPMLQIGIWLLWVAFVF